MMLGILVLSVSGVLFSNQAPQHYPLVIVGGGVAGFSAAIYGGNARIPTLLIKGPYLGGQLSLAGTVENMPGVDRISGIDIIEHLEQQALSFGAEFAYDTVLSCRRITTGQLLLSTESGQEYVADAVIIASGASPKTLGVPGEQQYWGHGVSTCALCDCLSAEGKEIVVIGGGDSAIEEALQLAPYATRITLLIRGSRFRASKHMQEKLESYDHIFYRFDTQVEEVVGDGHEMTGVRLRNTATGETEIFPAQGLFLAIGQHPDTQWISDFVACDDVGYIKLAEYQRTSQRGVFAAGGATDARYRQAGVASGDGIKAALDAIAYLRGIE